MKYFRLISIIAMASSTLRDLFQLTEASRALRQMVDGSIPM